MMVLSGIDKPRGDTFESLMEKGIVIAGSPTTVAKKVKEWHRRGVGRDLGLQARRALSIDRHRSARDGCVLSTRRHERIAADAVGEIVVGDPMEETTHLGPLGSQAQVERVRAIRASRSQSECRAALEAVDTAARGATNLVPPIIAAVEARATLGEIADVMRKVFGEHEEISPVTTATRS